MSSNRIYKIADAIESLGGSAHSWASAAAMAKLEPHDAAAVLDLMEIGSAAVVLALVEDEKCAAIVQACCPLWLDIAADELNQEESGRLTRFREFNYGRS